MRPLVILLIIIITAISVREDLSAGTIPHYSMSGGLSMNNVPSEGSQPEFEEILPTYQEVIIEPGQTLYGVVRKLHEPSVFNIPFHQVLADFEKLNPGTDGQNLQAGKSFKFPLYEITNTVE